MLNVQTMTDSTLEILRRTERAKFCRKGLVMQKTIALNENGRRIGESHPRAKLLDHEVDQVLDLLDAGLSYAEVALKFDVSKSCIAHIATGRRRGQVVERLVRVSV
jgi:DNA-binding NarL/FixJ family response regulator